MCVLLCADSVAGDARGADYQEVEQEEQKLEEPEPPTSTASRSSKARPYELYGSAEARCACYQAKRYERAWWAALDEEEDRRDDIMSKAEDKYIDAMLALKQAFPDAVCCVYFEIGGCEHGKACACGGTRPPWPWIRNVPDAPHRFCHCFTRAERLAWGCKHSIEHEEHGLWGLERLQWSRDEPRRRISGQFPPWSQRWSF